MNGTPSSVLYCGSQGEKVVGPWGIVAGPTMVIVDPQLVGSDEALRDAGRGAATAVAASASRRSSAAGERTSRRTPRVSTAWVMVVVTLGLAAYAGVRHAGFVIVIALCSLASCVRALVTAIRDDQLRKVRARADLRVIDDRARSMPLSHDLLVARRAELETGSADTRAAYLAASARLGRCAAMTQAQGQGQGQPTSLRPGVVERLGAVAAVVFGGLAVLDLVAQHWIATAIAGALALLSAVTYRVSRNRRLRDHAGGSTS